MRKYPSGEAVCGAIYDNAPADNPFLAALPEMLPKDEFLTAIRSTPGLPHNLPQLSPEERRQSLPMLASLFVPMAYMYAVYDQLYRAIRETYSTRTAIEEIRRINDCSAAGNVPLIPPRQPLVQFWGCLESARPPLSAAPWK